MADAWTERLARIDRRRAQTQHRKPPLFPGPKPWGTCQWCGKPILFPDGHKRAGQINTRRTWHADCAGWYKLAAWQGDAADAVWKRDRGRCQLCGADCPRRTIQGWRPRHVAPATSWVLWADQGPGESMRVWWARRGQPGAAEYTQVEPIERPSWQADHIVPLWSIPQPVSIDARGCLYGIVNLWLLCLKCAKAKTRREAAGRALAKRNALRGRNSDLLETTVGA